MKEGAAGATKKAGNGMAIWNTRPLENNQLSDFMTARFRSQDAFDANFTAWQQQHQPLLETAKAESAQLPYVG
jgi:hypothetical protein